MSELDSPCETELVPDSEAQASCRDSGRRGAVLRDAASRSRHLGAPYTAACLEGLVLYVEELEARLSAYENDPIEPELAALHSGVNFEGMAQELFAALEPHAARLRNLTGNLSFREQAAIACMARLVGNVENGVDADDAAACAREAVLCATRLESEMKKGGAA